MRLKTDENIHPSLTVRLRDSGYDATSVWDENLQGCSDPNLSSVCQTEGRILITQDIGFSDIRAYPPEEHPGFIVLRLKDQSQRSQLQVLDRLLPLFKTHPIEKRLWVVDEKRVRMRGAQS